MRESLIENYLVEQVQAVGGEVRKLQWIGRRHAPDRLVLTPHQAPFCVELKATGERPRPGQVREFARLAKLGLRVEIVDSFERVHEVLL
jgi:hypothetical protein